MATQESGASTVKPLICGLIMPISAIDGCSAEHWSDVKGILTEAVESISTPKFSVQLVSDSDDVGVIQKRIVKNIYSADIVICDVSGKNPNVMFELGMRLAFDKPTVIVKDDRTDYSFDTGIIEHVQYPRDLRFHRILQFKSALAAKVLATYNASQKDPEHSTFLKNFGKFHVASLNETEVHADPAIVEMLADIQSELAMMRRRPDSSAPHNGRSNEVGAARVREAVSKYMIKDPSSSPLKLVGDDEFYKWVESESGAPRVFLTRSAFRAAVDTVLREVAAASEQPAERGDDDR